MIPKPLKLFDTKENISLKKLTTLGLGGRARYLVTVRKVGELAPLLKALKKENIQWYVVGEGSNIVAPDKGFDGALVRIGMEELICKNNNVTVGSGANLLSFIRTLNKKGLSGMEHMAGIPGTVGGALYGNAGAYGQEIKDTLVSIRFFDGKKIRTIKKKDAKLEYRSSIFKKHPQWIILSATFRLKPAAAKELQKISQETILLREKKYPPGLKCPGSFFKNIKLDALSKKEREMLIKKLPKEKIMYGKVPTGYLLEQVRAKGMRQGGIRIAEYHGNLFYNNGNGTMRQVQTLAKKLRGKVKRKFGILLEEEVQYLPH